MDMDIWVDGTSNQHFKRGSLTETEFSKKQSRYWENSFLCDRFFCTPHSICLIIDF